MAAVPMQGILSAITPGVFDGLILALEKYGTKSFAEGVAPAFGYAEEGFPMPEEFGTMLLGYQRIITLWPASLMLFSPYGQPTPSGELFLSSRLAYSL